MGGNGRGETCGAKLLRVQRSSRDGRGGTCGAKRYKGHPGLRTAVVGRVGLSC